MGDLYASVAAVLGLDTGKLFAPFVGGQKFALTGKDTAIKGKPIPGLLRSSA